MVKDKSIVVEQKIIKMPSEILLMVHLGATVNSNYNYRQLFSISLKLMSRHLEGVQTIIQVQL